jgi:hypothetical protein
MFIGAYLSGYTGGPCTQEELDDWATNNGMTFPVLYVDISHMVQFFGNSIGTPSEVLLAPGMEVYKVLAITDADIEAVLPD